MTVAVQVTGLHRPSPDPKLWYPDGTRTQEFYSHTNLSSKKSSKKPKEMKTAIIIFGLLMGIVEKIMP